MDVPDFKKIALSDFTIDFGRLPMIDIRYPSGSVAVYSEFFKKVMRWVLKFLDTRHHDVSLRVLLKSTKVLIL